MDYGKEMKAIEAYKPNEYWKPEKGRHTVVIMSEPKEKVYIDEDNEKIPQIDLEISIKEKMMHWTITRSLGKDSLYAQLMSVGMARGKLLGVALNLTVFGEGKQKRYLVEPMKGGVVE